MLTHQRNKFAAVLVALPLLITALAGCANTSAPSGGSDSSSTSPPKMSAEDYDLAFAQCMRDEGVDMPDPESTSGATEPFKATPEFIAALETCQTELGDPPVGTDGGPGVSDQDQIDAQLALAACLRENGIDVPDPKPGEQLTLPMDASQDIIAECMGDGFSGEVAPGN